LFWNKIGTDFGTLNPLFYIFFLMFVPMFQNKKIYSHKEEESLKPREIECTHMAGSKVSERNRTLEQIEFSPVLSVG
jgi:hypothetical protein